MVEAGSGVAGQIGALIGGLVVVIGGAYGFIMRHKAKTAELRADVASSQADRAVADAQATAYNTISERIRQLEADVNSLRSELAAERKHNRKLDIHNRKLEIYIIKLVAMLKAAGVEVPPMETLPEFSLNEHVNEIT